MRRTIVLVSICFLAVALVPISATSHMQGRSMVAPGSLLGSAYVPNELLIGFVPGVIDVATLQGRAPDQTGIASLDFLNTKYGVDALVPLFEDLDPSDELAVQHGLPCVFKLTVPAGTDLFSMSKEYQQDPAILYAEPNLVFSITGLPNDPEVNKQWAIHNTGQTGGKEDADIDAPEAWDIERGDKSVMIAIVDTGVDYGHPDLAGGRVRTDIDRDFWNDDENAMDDHGHGTYCAGIAAANTHNSRGMAGVCQGCQILPIKVLDSEGTGTAETVSQGIQYAAQAGSKIISMSLGYPSTSGCSETVARTINYAFERGCLLIAASGNDSDKVRLSYPASSPRVLSVGASNDSDQEADFSNKSTVLDILAPGVDIYSLNLNGEYATESGTSAAAPHVSGVAGLLWSHRPSLTNTKLWWILYDSADGLNYGSGGEPSASLPYRTFFPGAGVTGFGRLNAYEALCTPAASEFGAPKDFCTGEPDALPGCSAEIVLFGKSEAKSALEILHRFRNEVLAESALGQRWIELYEGHRIEAALILLSDGDFRGEVLDALQQWLPLFLVLVKPESMPPQQTILTPERAQALESVINGLADRGGARLRADLEEVRVSLQLERFLGWDVRDAWQELNEGR